VGIAEENLPWRWRKSPIMKIDDNEKELCALREMISGDGKAGLRMQREFLEEVKASGQDYCSCTAKCAYHGNCVDCVIIHRGHADHLPECFRSMVNRRIMGISGLTEHSLPIGSHKDEK
jgi:hypothetical protein